MTLYKRHFLSLFIGSCVTVVVLFVAFAMYGSVTWVGAFAERRTALYGGLLATPVAMLLVMGFLEREIYAKDTWTLDRLGMQPLSFVHSKKAYLMGLLPFLCLLIAGISNAWEVSSSFANPYYTLLIIGQMPVVVFEESLFRGVYWKYIVIRFAKGKSMLNVFLINALLFSVIHLPSLFIRYCDGLLAGDLGNALIEIVLLFAMYFVTGLILGILRDAHDSLVAPLAYHLVYNILFFTIEMNPVWLMIVQAALVAALLAIRETGWFRPTEKKRSEEAIQEFQRPIMETPLHTVVRWFFLVGNGMVLYYYGSEMSIGDASLFMISSIVIVTSYAFLGFLYSKRMFFFKLPSE
ncbi:MAG: CPBP family intramembrane metalloprotease [Candidatus Lokiarchaeota archaeon]|nr:CPBP family intramembrane metalloprotease [Candidatus Lokiarchaeota archaeon]